MVPASQLKHWSFTHRLHHMQLLRLQEQPARLITTLDTLQSFAEQLQTQFESIRGDYRTADCQAKRVVRFHAFDD